MTVEDAQEIANIANKFCTDEENNRITVWSSTAFLSTLKLKLEEIVKKDTENAESEVAKEDS